MTGGRRSDRRELDLEAGDGVLEVPLRGDVRMDLTEPADGLAVDQHRGGAAGMQKRLASLSGRTSQSTPERREQTGEHALGGEEVGLRRVLVAPGRQTDRTGQQRAEVVGLLDEPLGGDRLCRGTPRLTRTARSCPAPRARLRSATSSSEPSSVVRSCDCSEDIGLASVTGARRR